MIKLRGVSARSNHVWDSAGTEYRRRSLRHGPLRQTCCASLAVTGRSRNMKRGPVDANVARVNDSIAGEGFKANHVEPLSFHARGFELRLAARAASFDIASGLIRAPSPLDTHCSRAAPHSTRRHPCRWIRRARRGSGLPRNANSTIPNFVPIASRGLLAREFAVKADRISAERSQCVFGGHTDLPRIRIDGGAGDFIADCHVNRLCARLRQIFA